MRIIAGKYRGRNLKSPPSMQVRPTSDRLRETLFNVIAPRIEEARFLDLCAGSGAVGIEALSRGAAHSTFVDRSRKMCGLIEANLDLCQIPEVQTEVVQSEALEFLKRSVVRKFEPWDIVFYDPPYATNYADVLTLIGSHPTDLLQKNGLVIVEHHHKNNLSDSFGSIIRTRILKQGDSALSFYKRLESEAEPCIKFLAASSRKFLGVARRTQPSIPHWLWRIRLVGTTTQLKQATLCDLARMRTRADLRPGLSKL